MEDFKKLDDVLKNFVQKWFNTSRYSMRYQNRQLSECGDIVVKLIEPQRIDTADFAVQSLVEESIEWKLPLENIKMFSSSIAFHLKREYVFRYCIEKALDHKLGFGDEPSSEISVISDVDEISSDNFNMTDFRLSTVQKVVKNLLDFGGFKMIHPTENPTLIISIVRNRNKEFNAFELVCGPVTSQFINAKDYVKKRANDMQLIAQHKYGIRVRDHRHFQETIASLGRSAAIVDMLESKASSPVDMRKDKYQSSKGASFILYNYARLSVIFETLSEKQKIGYYPELPSLEDIDFSRLEEEDEWHLFWVYVAGFPNMVKQALGDGQLERLSPHLVLAFTSGLVICLSKYYRRIRILTENRDHLLSTMFARIYMLKSVYYVLSTLLNMLDLEAVTQM
ncbi:DALR anticodon-binding domain-containing protein 3 [Armigeres subalbatus]|uniref:DALR anticodon-binding domain-containing protein 3 n=1 Tax=Armigeres subalbatus TaxID=124917 RepID=UPI002ED20C69